MLTAYDIVKTIIHTEKGTNVLNAQNKYLFWVTPAANKVQIKKAVEDIYKVKVKKVATLVMPGKAKRVRYVEGKTPDWKKAVVTLQEGNKIETT